MKPTKLALNKKIAALKSEFYGVEFGGLPASASIARLEAALDKWERATVLLRSARAIFSKYTDDQALCFAVTGEYPADYLSARAMQHRAFEIADGRESAE